MTDIRARAAAIFAGMTFRLILLAIIALLLVNTYADIRVPLPLVPDIHFEGWKPKAQRLGDDLEAVLEAQKEAAKAQRAVNDAAERRYQDIAERIDTDAPTNRAEALADADRFIAAHRVRREGNSPCRPDSAAPDNGAGNAEAVHTAAELDGAVAVPAEDIRICTVNTLLAEAGQRLALEFEADGGN